MSSDSENDAISASEFMKKLAPAGTSSGKTGSSTTRLPSKGKADSEESESESDSEGLGTLAQFQNQLSIVQADNKAAKEAEATVLKDIETLNFEHFPDINEQRHELLDLMLPNQRIETFDSKNGSFNTCVRLWLYCPKVKEKRTFSVNLSNMPEIKKLNIKDCKPIYRNVNLQLINNGGLKARFYELNLPDPEPEDINWHFIYPREQRADSDVSLRDTLRAYTFENGNDGNDYNIQADMLQALNPLVHPDGVTVELKTRELRGFQTVPSRTVTKQLHDVKLYQLTLPQSDVDALTELSEDGIVNNVVLHANERGLRYRLGNEWEPFISEKSASVVKLVAVLVLAGAIPARNDQSLPFYTQDDKTVKLVERKKASPKKGANKAALTPSQAAVRSTFMKAIIGPGVIVTVTKGLIRRNAGESDFLYVQLDSSNLKTLFGEGVKDGNCQLKIFSQGYYAAPMIEGAAYSPISSRTSAGLDRIRAQLKKEELVPIEFKASLHGTPSTDPANYQKNGTRPKRDRKAERRAGKNDMPTKKSSKASSSKEKINSNPSSVSRSSTNVKPKKREYDSADEDEKEELERGKKKRSKVIKTNNKDENGVEDGNAKGKGKGKGKGKERSVNDN